MIMFGYTCFANATMFTPCRLGKLTRRADFSRLEKNVIIWILLHPIRVICGSDVGSCGCHRLVNKDMRNNAQRNDKDAVKCG